MSAETTSLDQVLVADREQWKEGPPHELFKRLRSECPVHWSAGISEYPEEAGYWSVTRPDEIHEVSRDWETYSSANGITAITDAIMPVDLIRAMFIGMDPPKHDRLKNLFQRGFTPRRIAEHEEPIREIVTRVLDGISGPPARETCDLVPDVAPPPGGGRLVPGRPPADRLARDRQLQGPAARGRRAVGAAHEHDDGRRR